MSDLNEDEVIGILQLGGWMVHISLNGNNAIRYIVTSDGKPQRISHRVYTGIVGTYRSNLDGTCDEKEGKRVIQWKWK